MPEGWASVMKTLMFFFVYIVQILKGNSESCVHWTWFVHSFIYWCVEHSSGCWEYGKEEGFAKERHSTEIWGTRGHLAGTPVRRGMVWHALVHSPPMAVKHNCTRYRGRQENKNIVAAQGRVQVLETGSGSKSQCGPSPRCEILEEITDPSECTRVKAENIGSVRIWSDGMI